MRLSLRLALRLPLLLAGLLLLQCVIVRPVDAQFGGMLMELYGMVSFAPGSQVVTLAVGKGETLRFRVQDVKSRHPDFSVVTFLSEIRHRQPNLYIKGPGSLCGHVAYRRARKTSAQTHRLILCQCPKLCAESGAAGPTR